MGVPGDLTGLLRDDPGFYTPLSVFAAPCHHEFAGDPEAIAAPVGGDGGEALGLHLLARRGVEALGGKRHRASVDFRGQQRRLVDPSVGAVSTVWIV